MAKSDQTTGVLVEAGLTPDGKEMLSDPAILGLAALGLISYLIGRFVIGRRDPDKPRKWWDYRRID